jgi:RHS repeat-associated protein
VNDPESGFVYMQARYYDPDTGLFLSVDPIWPEPGSLFNLGRYGYANGNPVNYIDPDGRAVQFAFEDDRARMGAVGMAIYLAFSPTFRDMYLRLDNSRINYILMFGHSTRNRYLPTLKRIYINPELGTTIKSSGEIQSPAVAASHEIAHAFDNDGLGDNQFAKESKTSVADAGGKVIPKDDVEEERATRLESSVARELGEPTRKSYTDAVKSVTTCSPTSRKVCGN